MDVNYDEYKCHYTTIEARIYTDFKPDAYQQALTEVFNVYIIAFRDAAVVTLYLYAFSLLFFHLFDEVSAFIGGFIGFFIVSAVVMALIRKMLQKFNALKVSRKR